MFFFLPPLRKKKLQKHFYLKVTSWLFHSARLSGPSPPSLFHYRSTEPNVAQLSLTVASHPGGSCFSKTPLSISGALFLRPSSSSLCTSHSSSSHIVTNLSHSLLFPAPLSLSFRSISNASACSSSLSSCCFLFFIIPGSLCGLGWGLRLRPSLYANSEGSCAKKRKLLSHSHQASTNAHMHKQTRPASCSASPRPHPACSRVAQSQPVELDHFL